MSETKINIEHQTNETSVDVRRVAVGLGIAAAAAGGIMAAKLGFGGEAASAPELPHHTDKQVTFTLEQGGTVQDGAFAHAREQTPDLMVEQEGQIITSSREAARANGIPQPGDGFTLNIGEYDGKPGVDYKVTPQGVSSETENK